MVAAPAVQHLWLDFVKQRVPHLQTEVEAVADRFAGEMRRYCEFIQGPGGTPVGLMVRGEGTDFTNRVQQQLQGWHMPAAGLAYHASLAEMFEHKRAFLKLEWDRSKETGQIEHLAAFYFRRRPVVKRVLECLQGCGVQRDILEQAAYVAQLLGKDSVHFVAAALRPGRTIRHKLYFSQYVTPITAETVLQRFLEVMALFKIDPNSTDQWRHYHNILAPPEREPTIFGSVSFENNFLMLSLKIDYPEVSPQTAVMLLPPKEREKATADIRQLCLSAGDNVENLSYLGVRFHRSGSPSLKYYADFYPNF